MANSGTAASGLAAVLRNVVGDLQRASGADIVSLVLYDATGPRYYAPFAAGQPEDDLLNSLTDMDEQLARYLADLEQGKAPEELGIHQYGSTTWLTVTRRMLVARDAVSEIDSTFVRRNHVQSMIGLPLLADDRLIGLVYLNYCAPAGSAASAKASRVPDDAGVRELERAAVEAAATVQAALVTAERTALEGISRLTSLLTASLGGPNHDPGELRRTFSIALAELLLAAQLDAAAIYEFVSHRTRLELVTAHAPAASPPRVGPPAEGEAWETVLGRAVGSAMAGAGVHPVATIPLGDGAEPLGYLVVASRDRLATVRRAPVTDLLLRAAAELVGGALASRRLIGDLEHRGRLLAALGGMTNAMIRPGASRQDVLDALVGHLTDALVPEFDFHFATVYLLGELPDGSQAVRMASGAATTERIDSTQVGDGARPAAKRGRVPKWALDQARRLSPNDVLVHVAHHWQVVVIGPAGLGPGEAVTDMISGTLPAPVEWTQVPAVRSDGVTVAVVPVCLLGAPLAGAEVGSAGAEAQPPFELAGDLFESSGHGDLIRIFLPFGLAATERATGVLEVGYHRSSERRPDWGQIEALRAAASQVAVAVESARLTEQATHHAEQLELSADVSRAIASSIDLEQTLRLVARNLVRLVNASLCQIALYEEDGEGWFGAAASDQEEEWRHHRGERPQTSFLFEVLDRGEPLLVEDVSVGDLVSPEYAQTFGVRSLLVLPLVADGQRIGAAVLAERGRRRTFTDEERDLAQGLAHQAAVAIKNARLHALAEEERHIQKDFLLIGLGQWGGKAYRHLQTLKQFFNFRVHVIEHESPGARERLQAQEQEVRANGDLFYWDSPGSPAHDQLLRELEPSCYVITYIATPAATHLPTLALYYDISDVVLIEKPLGAPPEEYREFLASAPAGVEIVAADHYYFKLEVRLLQSLLSEERTLRDFLDSVGEIAIEILEEQPLAGAAADIGVVADLIPHAFAIISLFTPIDRIKLDSESALLVGRHEGLAGSRESYARLNASFPYKGRSVRLTVDAGKGVENAKWIKLNSERRLSGRSPFYKFDFGNGEAIDGTQSTVRAAVRRIREPGVPDNAHLTMLRHVIDKRRPAVGILSIREAIRANQRIRELDALAVELLARGEFTQYAVGTRPAFKEAKHLEGLPSGAATI